MTNACVCIHHITPCAYILFLTSSFCLDCIRYGAQLIVSGDITFEQLMTAMLALMLGALGLGQALNDLGDLLHPCLPSFNPLFQPLSLYCCLPTFLPKLRFLYPTPLSPTPLSSTLHSILLCYSYPLLSTYMWTSRRPEGRTPRR